MSLRSLPGIIVVLLLIFMVSCSRCSKAESPEVSKSSYVTDAESLVQTPSDEGLQRVSGGEGSQGADGVRQTSVKFVQTPDGKVVPEPILRLKVPDLLNPRILKNAIKQQNQDMEKKADIKE